MVVFGVDRAEVLGLLLDPVADLTASATWFALKLLAVPAVRDGLVMYEPGGFAYEIHYRCTGFLPVAIFTIAVLAYPARPARKATGLGVGIPVLLIVNFVRLVDLFVIGVSRPEAFAFAHEVLWQGFMALAVLWLWAVWSRWVRVTKYGVADGWGRAP